MNAMNMPGSNKNEEMCDIRNQPHQPNIIGNIEDLSLAEASETNSNGQVAYEDNAVFSKSKSLTRRQSKAMANN